MRLVCHSLAVRFQPQRRGSAERKVRCRISILRQHQVKQAFCFQTIGGAEDHPQTGAGARLRLPQTRWESWKGAVRTLSEIALTGIPQTGMPSDSWRMPFGVPYGLTVAHDRLRAAQAPVAELRKQPVPLQFGLRNRHTQPRIMRWRDAIASTASSGALESIIPVTQTSSNLASSSNRRFAANISQMCEKLPFLLA